MQSRSRSYKLESIYLEGKNHSLYLWVHRCIVNNFISRLQYQETISLRLPCPDRPSLIIHYVWLDFTIYLGRFCDMQNNPQRIFVAQAMNILSALTEQLMSSWNFFVFGSKFVNFLYYKARHAHKRLYTVLPKYSKIQVLPGITSCRLMKYNKQAIELNSLLNK